MRNSSSLDWLRFMHTPNDYRVSLALGYADSKIPMKEKKVKADTVTIVK